jgi:hypothetical protein
MTKKKMRSLMRKTMRRKKKRKKKSQIQRNRGRSNHFTRIKN